MSSGAVHATDTVRSGLQVDDDAVLLAAYAVLLHRYTGTADLVVGVGPGVPVRIDLGGDPGFAEVVERARRAHDDARTGELPARGGPPRFTVGYRTDSGLPLDLALAPGHLTYRTDLFQRATAERMLRHLEILLADGLDRPRCPISRLDLLPSAEREDILVGWNDTGRAGAPATLPALFGARVRERGDAVALVFEDTELSYVELDERANRLAHLLVARGAGPERVVATRPT